MLRHIALPHAIDAYKVLHSNLVSGTATEVLDANSSSSSNTTSHTNTAATSTAATSTTATSTTVINTISSTNNGNQRYFGEICESFHIGPLSTLYKHTDNDLNTFLISLGKCKSGTL